MPTILELFNQKEVLNYMKERQFPALLGETLFPEVKKQDLEFEMIKGGSSLPVIASVHGFDTESEIGSRESVGSQAIELALIKRKLQLKEKDIIAIENPRNDAEKQDLMQQVFNDIDTLTAGVRARVEAMRMEVLSNGTVTLDENDLDMTINYHVPEENKEALTGTGLWTNPDSDPIEDLLRWADQLNGNPTRALTSSAVLTSLLRHPKVIASLFGKDSARIVTRADLNAFMTQHELPTIGVYNQKYRKQEKNGTYTTHRYFPNNKFVMFGEGTLGETLYGPTAEETRLARNPAVDISMVGKVLAMVYEETVDPVSTFTKAVATALPSFPVADEVFQAQPIA